MRLKNFVAALLKRSRDELSDRMLIVNQQDGSNVRHITRGSIDPFTVSNAARRPSKPHRGEGQRGSIVDWTFTYSIAAWGALPTSLRFGFTRSRPGRHMRFRV